MQYEQVTEKVQQKSSPSSAFGPAWSSNLCLSEEKDKLDHCLDKGVVSDLGSIRLSFCSASRCATSPDPVEMSFDLVARRMQTYPIFNEFVGTIHTTKNTNEALTQPLTCSQ